MAGQLHADFPGHAGIRQCGIKTVPEGMEGPLGEQMRPFAGDGHGIKARPHDDAFEALAQSVIASQPIVRKGRAEEPLGPELGETREAHRHAAQREGDSAWPSTLLHGALRMR